MVDDYIEALHVLLRETLLKKGFPSIVTFPNEEISYQTE